MRVLFFLVALSVSADPGMSFPVATEDFLIVSSPSGWRVSPTLKVLSYHNGIDITAVMRAQVTAAMAGRVVEIWPAPDGWFRGHPTYGGYVVIDHGDGWTTEYAHLSTTYVTGWQAVKQGQVIGRIGNTGQTVSEHLHFVVKYKGKPVNPLLYIRIPMKR